MKKKLKWIVIAALAIFAAMQFYHPAHTNPPVTNDFIAATAPPPPLAAAFRAACYDCHSYETHWPWYSHLAPISWDLVKDVNFGRDNLDLSAWPTNNTE
ncbi:MAG TPA: heme-binding domain-containing protein, partial [Desulfuromonadaceae bacterium]|nr:heme-binding domain-containing protein [Desulfuromonadaceae bacterium]